MKAHHLSNYLSLVIFKLALCFWTSFLMHLELRAIEPIHVGAYFLMIAPDARGVGMGHVGVASGADVYSQYWNASKYMYASQNSGLGVTFTPWFMGFTNDVYLSTVQAYTKLGAKNALGASLRYFHIGDMQATNDLHTVEGYFSPKEYAFDCSYIRAITPSWAMSVTPRWVMSDYRAPTLSASNSMGTTWLIDLASYGEHKLKNTRYGDILSWGIVLANIGNEIVYDGGLQSAPMPAILRLGASWKGTMINMHQIRLNIDVEKMLVPHAKDDIKYGSVFQSMIKSMSDSEDGFKGEIQASCFSLGGEYSYGDTFFVRCGFSSEGAMRTNGELISLGLGLVYRALHIDIAYVSMLNAVRQSADILSCSLTFQWK